MSAQILVNVASQRLEDVEREFIIAKLWHCGGNRRKAAEELGIGLRTLYRKLDRYRNEGHELPRQNTANNASTACKEDK